MVSETAVSSLGCASPVVLNHGKVRTGKTRCNVHKQLALHFQHRGMVSCVARANNVDLNNTGRQDFRDVSKYDFDDPRSPIRSYGGVNFTSLYVNDGEIRFGGLNNPRHLLGTGYDLINTMQLEEITLEQYQLLQTRLSGENVILPNGSYLMQFISDSNPDEPDWWAYQLEREGVLKIYEFDFTDNPSFFREDRWSKRGYQYVHRLSRTMPPGVLRDRYFHGLRVSAAGSVFTISKVHLIDRLPDIGGYHIFNAIDFATTGTAVILWIAWHRTLNDIIVFKEWRKTNTNIMEVGDTLTSINAMEGITPELTIIDNDGDNASVLDQYFGIRVQMTTKGPRSVERNYQYIAAKLVNTLVPDRGNGIRFYTGMPAYFDPSPEAQTQPKDLIQELRQVKRDTSGKIDKLGGHGVDALGYFLAWVVLTYQESQQESHGLNLYDLNRGTVA